VAAVSAAIDCRRIADRSQSRGYKARSAVRYNRYSATTLLKWIERVEAVRLYKLCSSCVTLRRKLVSDLL